MPYNPLGINFNRDYRNSLNAQLKELYDRLNNIVAESGDSNIEIVDARMGADGVVRTTVGELIREIHQILINGELERVGIDVNGNLTIDGIAYESGASIDDATTSTTTVWSSQKTSNEISVLSSDLGSLTSHFAETIPLIDSLLNGYHSPELFTLPNGINEFDFLYINGLYHLFYDDKTQTKHRQASTIEGLSSAIDDLTISGRYPSAYYENGIWHLFVLDASVTKHYTSTLANGAYTYVNSLPVNKADIHVRKSPIDGNYYAGYKDMSVANLPMGILKTSSLDDAWTDLGHVFSDIGRCYWHSIEEADPAPFFHNGKSYVSFAGWDGFQQRVAIVEVNNPTMKATKPATVIVNPIETWQKRNSQNKVFNPVFLSTDECDRLYYSHNPSAAGIITGWGFVEVGKLLSVRRNYKDLVNLDFTTLRDTATGILMNIYGSAIYNGRSLVTSSTTGGAYGHIGLNSITDFTFTIEFTPTTIPSAGTFSLLGRFGKRNRAYNPIVGIWLNGAKIYCEVHNNDGVTNCNLTGTTTLIAGARYRVTVRKIGNEVLLYLNGVLEASGTHTGLITGLEEWAIGNQQSSINSSAQQFNGEYHKVHCVGVPLPIHEL